jgi:hypothetical protein
VFLDIGAASMHRHLAAFNPPVEFETCIILFVILLATIFCSSCGGGSSEGGGGSGPAASYTISLSASTLTLTASGSQTLTVTVNPANGFNATVRCGINVLPSGVTASPASFSVTVANPAVVSFSVSASASMGTSTVTVGCNSTGYFAQEAQFSLAVQVTPSISLSASPSSLSLDPGTNGSTGLSVNGAYGASGAVTGTVTGLPAGVTVNQPTFNWDVNAGALQLQFTAAATATTSGSATIAVNYGTLTASLTIPISVVTTPDFGLSLSEPYVAIYQTESQAFTLSTSDYNGFNAPIAVSFTGVPAGITFTPSSFTLQPGGSQSVVVSGTFAASVTSTNVSITGAAGSITHETPIAVTVEQPFVVMLARQSSLTVPAGSADSFEIEAGTPQDTTGTVNVQINGAPPGVTVTPSSLSFQAGSEYVSAFEINLSTTSSAISGTLTAMATFGPYSESVSIPLTISAPENTSPVPLTTADQLVRSDALTPYLGFTPLNYLVYNANSNRFFYSDALLNQLNVVDGSTHTLTTTLTIPGAFAIDQSADGSTVWVATLLGDLYMVDPVGLTIEKRYPSSEISPYGFVANAVYALADGELLLETYNWVYPGVDGVGPLAVWDPATNDISVLEAADESTGGEPTTNTCFERFQNLVLTNNRTRALLVPVPTSEGSSTLCSLNPEAGTWTLSSTISGGQGSTLGSFAVSSDGNTVVAYDGYDIYNLNPTTLAVKSSFAFTPNGTASFVTMFLSQDNTEVFLTDPDGADVLDVYNLASSTQTGWIPEVNVGAAEGFPTPPLYQAMNANGVAAGVVQGGGLGLLDSTAVHALPIGTRLVNTPLDQPYGPLAGGTAVSWPLQEDGGTLTFPPLGSVYFGSNAASELNNDGSGDVLAAVTPSGATGPVDVRTFATDGDSQLIPAGFSYGPWVQEAATSYATAEGGGPASIYGFGFGPQEQVEGTTYVTPGVPSDLQIFIGGAAAGVVEFNPIPYQLYTGIPLPTNSVVYTVPPGVAGNTATIQVSDVAGSTTATTQMTYLPALQKYPVDGELVDGVFDPTRDVYYFTDSDQVRVFSLASGTWLPSISIPAPTSAQGPQRLFGIALSADGSKLVVSDAGAVAVYVLDPDTPTSIESFPLAGKFDSSNTAIAPSDVAITNSATVFFTTFETTNGAEEGLYELNSSTGQVTYLSSYLNYAGAANQSHGRLALSSDGSRLYASGGGVVGYYDVASGQFSYAPVANSELSQGADELALSPTQQSLFGSGFVYDSNLNNLGYQVLDVAEAVDADSVYGAAFSADGDLLFQPGDSSIDVFNGSTGSFLTRISLPVELSPNFRAMCSWPLRAQPETELR